MGLAAGRAFRNALGCQLGVGCSLIAGTRRAVGRSLPGTSLAFALMAAINGSAGSSATLSHGLNGTKPHRRQSDGSKDFHPSWATAQAVPDAVAQIKRVVRIDQYVESAAETDPIGASVSGSRVTQQRI
jgi:hypothetical protein